MWGIFSLFPLCFINYTILNTALVLSQILKGVTFSLVFWHTRFKQAVLKGICMFKAEITMKSFTLEIDKADLSEPSHCLST